MPPAEVSGISDMGPGVPRDNLSCGGGHTVSRMPPDGPGRVGGRIGETVLPMKVLGLGIRLTILASLWALPASADEQERFETEVRPVLAKHCWACHRQSAMGGLRLDSRAGMLQGGKSGPAVVPSKPDESLLIQAVTHRHEKLRMPPQERLGPDQIAALAEWVRRGAFWPEHPETSPKSGDGEYVITAEQRAFWSFQPVRRVQPPAVRGTDWARSAIDRFVLARLEQEGLRPVAQAGKRSLIRRATFDLTGLPAAPPDVEAFAADSSPDAFRKVVDRLLASPQYGERWGRYWLDVARYADDKFNSTQFDPYPNSFRYRNWVIRAFNEDMPYNLFVKAQIAGDRMEASDPEKYTPGLGFYGLSPEMQDDRVDATTRAFLGLTVACAQCHDHKFDPIPTKDYYSIQGIFANTKLHEWPLAGKDVVDTWQAKKRAVDDQQKIVDRFYETQREQLNEVFAAQTAWYLLAANGVASEAGLDSDFLGRWKKYLAQPQKDHPYLKDWSELVSRGATAAELEKAAHAFQALVVAINEEKREVDEKNKITLGRNPNRGDIAGATLESLERDRYIVWRDLFERSTRDAAGFFATPNGTFYSDRKKIDAFLQGHWKGYAESQAAALERKKKELPEQYPFLQVIADRDKPVDMKVHIRGDRNNLGDLAPRRFLAILSPAERKTFSDGSGRLELAEAIVDPGNPLTARVMVNRIWQYHFGRGLVGTASNFGQLGERPTHPELLDYLAARFIESGGSIKALHREIMLSATYALSSVNDQANAAKDPENRLLWRANRRRLDAEAMRDAILFVAGTLDATPADKAVVFDDNNVKRTVYGYISRRKLDGTLALFDFPNPNNTSEARNATNVPVQRLYFMNSTFVEKHAGALAKRFDGSDESRIRSMYQALFGRDPDEAEVKMGLEFVKSDGWPVYAQVLLSSNEFLFVD
jgi:mono/diheme cytochrome c family protein